MLKKIVQHSGRIVFVIAFVLLLALIRAYEDSLFYDPFLNYFKGNYHNLPLPQTDKFRLFLGLFFRYVLNTAISLAIIYTLFRDSDAIKFSSLLYALFFILLTIAFFYVLLKNDEPNKMVLFYIRRFLIQPLFLLLFLPAFFYQKQKN